MEAPTAVGANSGAGCGTKPTDLRPCEYFVSSAGSSAQSRWSVLTRDCSGSWASVSASTSTRCMLVRGSPCGGEMTVSSRANSPSCRASSFLRIANLCLEVRISNKGSKGRAPLRASMRVPTGPLDCRIDPDAEFPSVSVSFRRSAIAVLAEFNDLSVACDLPDPERTRSANPARWIRQSSVSMYVSKICRVDRGSRTSPSIVPWPANQRRTDPRSAHASCHSTSAPSVGPGSSRSAEGALDDICMTF